MKVVKWIVQVFVAVAFLIAGGVKLITPYDELAMQEGMTWVGDVSRTQIMIISLLEVLGAIGLIVPMFVKKFQMLVPLAALGLALTMVAAAIFHIVRGEPFIPNIVLFLPAALTFWWRRDLLKKGE
jgi:hypothetical protein